MTRDLPTIAQDLIRDDPSLADEIRRQLIDANLDVLTQRQRECLDFIQAYSAESARAPSLATIAAHFGTTRSNIHRMVIAIESHGFVRRGPSGAIEFVEVA